MEKVSQSLGEHRQFVGFDAGRYGRVGVYKNDIRVERFRRKQYSPENHESGVVSGASDYLDPEDRTKRRQCVIYVFCPVALGYT